MTRNEKKDRVLNEYLADWMTIIVSNLEKGDVKVLDPDNPEVILWVEYLHLNEFIPKYNRKRNKFLGYLMSEVFASSMTITTGLVNKYGAEGFLALYSDNTAEINNSIKLMALENMG